MDIYLFQSGLFDIRVKSITAVDSSVSYPSPAVDIGAAAYVKTLIESTIQSGGVLYDYGYRGLCIAVYKSTLNTLLAADILSKSNKSMICQGLQRAETQITSKVDAAWTLRNTLDAIMEEMGFSDPIPGRWRPDATVDAASLGYQCSGVTSGAYITNVTSEPTHAPTTKAPTVSPTFAPIETDTPTMKPIMPPTPAPTDTTSEPLIMMETNATITKLTILPMPTDAPTAVQIKTAAPSMKPTTSSTPVPTLSSDSTMETITTMGIPTIEPTYAPSNVIIKPTPPMIATKVSVSNEIIPAPQAPTAAVDDEVADKQNNDTMSSSANETKTKIDGGTASSAILASSGTSFSSIAGIVATLTASILLCFGL